MERRTCSRRYSVTSWLFSSSAAEELVIVDRNDWSRRSSTLPASLSAAGGPRSGPRGAHSNGIVSFASKANASERACSSSASMCASNYSGQLLCSPEKATELNLFLVTASRQLLQSFSVVIMHTINNEPSHRLCVGAAFGVAAFEFRGLSGDSVACFCTRRLVFRAPVCSARSSMLSIEEREREESATLVIQLRERERERETEPGSEGHPLTLACLHGRVIACACAWHETDTRV